MSEPDRATSVAPDTAYASATKHPLVSIVLAALHDQDARSYHGVSGEEMGERAWGVLKAIEDAGFTILRTKSYKAAQERQRLAEVMRRMAEDDKRSQREWLERDVFPQERHWINRMQHLGALATRLGATSDDLWGPCDCAISNCLGKQRGASEVRETTQARDGA